MNSDAYDDIADFSNAVQVVESPMRSDPAGVIFWQVCDQRQSLI